MEDEVKTKKTIMLGMEHLSVKIRNAVDKIPVAGLEDALTVILLASGLMVEEYNALKREHAELLKELVEDEMSSNAAPRKGENC